MSGSGRTIGLALGLLSLTTCASMQCPSICRCYSTAERLEVHCESRGLTYIPAGIPTNATHLFLNGNRISGIAAGTLSNLTVLQELHLNNNHLQSDLLHPAAFLRLHKLKRLFLTQNRLSNLEYGLFQDLTSLERLYLTQNQLTVIPDIGNCTNLYKFMIDNNYVKNAKFPDSFKHLKQLTTLVLTNNHIEYLSADDMSPLINSNIQAIYLSRNPLVSVRPKAFAMFPQLKSLALSYLSKLNISSVRNIVNDLGASRYLIKLDLSNSLQDSVPRDLFAKLSEVPLEILYMAHMTRVTVIENGTFVPLRKLTYLDLSESKSLSVIQDGAFDRMNSSLERLDISSCRLALIPRALPYTLQKLDLHHNSYIDTINEGDLIGLGSLSYLDISHCTISLINSYSFTSLSSLRSLDLSENQLSGTSIGVRVLQPLTNLSNLTLKGNRMTQISTESRLFEQQASLVHLDMSDNDCEILPRDIFRPLSSLKWLDLSGNSLGMNIADNDGTLFQGLSSVEHLNVATNQLFQLPEGLLDPLKNLATLELSNNWLSQWPDGFFNSTRHLSLVDLSINRIAVVNSTSVECLPLHVQLNLSGNPFNCWCDLIWFRTWMGKMINDSDVILVGAENYTCLSPKLMNKKKVLSFKPGDIHSVCFPPPWMYIVIVSAAGAAGVIVIVVSLAYRYRWPIRLQLYYCGKRCRGRPLGRPGYEPLAGEDDQQQYDVFVSYGPSDRDQHWVKQKLVPALDKDRGGKWSVGFEEKILANSGIIGELADMIYTSRKIMFVVSREFLKDSRRQYEIEIAVTAMSERQMTLCDSIILVILEEAASVKVPSVLHPLMAEQRQLVWTESNEYGCQLFWEQLEEKIADSAPSSAHNIQV